jgi:hypothetical protein
MSTKQGFGIGFALALALAVGWFGRGFQAPSSAPNPNADPREGTAEGPCPGGTQPLYWVAPLDPYLFRVEPGIWPLGLYVVFNCS